MGDALVTDPADDRQVLTRKNRAAAVLGGPALAWLRARLRARLARGQRLTGVLTLAEPTPEQRNAVERLFGRLARGRAVRVDVDEVDRLIRDAAIAADLAEAMTILEGPIEDLKRSRTEREERWASVFAEARVRGDGSPWSDWHERWIVDLEGTGLLRRLAADDPAAGGRLLAAALATLERLPGSGIPLAELAAAATGDSHALDSGAPIGTLVLKAISTRAGSPLFADPDDRRSAWASVGVLADELSAPALVLNLRGCSTGPMARALALAADTGEPYRLSTRQLLREPPSFQLPPDRHIFVCENPTVVAAAANQLGAHARPLLCTEGQPRTALRMLLARLRDAGAVLAYHGDFDWPGIQIANFLRGRFSILPWRFGAGDYLSAPEGLPLAGVPVVASWDSNLSEAMKRRGRAVHEEAVLVSLLTDLSAS